MDLSKKKVIFLDTDIGGDCDDAGAIALVNIFKNLGYIDVLGMTHTTSIKYGPATIDAINTYYGNDFPIGATKRKNYCLFNTKEFTNKICNAFTHKYDNRDDIEDAISLIRRLLSTAKDNSVTFVCIGQLNNVSDLLDSRPDKYSSLSGIELVKNKVCEFVVMGGLFNESGEKIYFYNQEYKVEYNIACDIKSAQNFIKKVPVKVVFSDFLNGYQTYTGKSLLENKLNSPVKMAYEIFINKPRESWDLLTVWYAMFGSDDIFKISCNGTINILDDGITLFDNKAKNNHYYLRIINDNSYIENKIDNALLKGLKITQKASKI